MHDLKKGEFPVGPLGLNEGYTARVPQAPSLSVLLHDGGVLLLLVCPFPSLSESPGRALLCGGSLCPHECCRWRGRYDVLPTPMGSEFAQSTGCGQVLGKVGVGRVAFPWWVSPAD